MFQTKSCKFLFLNLVFQQYYPDFENLSMGNKWNEKNFEKLLFVSFSLILVDATKLKFKKL